MNADTVNSPSDGTVTSEDLPPARAKRETRGVAYLLIGGPQRIIRDETGKLWHFEMHGQCGPCPTDEHGELVKEPGPRSPFWEAATQWARQGERVGEDGLCVWEPAPTRRYVHAGGRHWVAEDSPLAAKFAGNKTMDVKERA